MGSDIRIEMSGLEVKIRRVAEETGDAISERIYNARGRGNTRQQQDLVVYRERIDLLAQRFQSRLCLCLVIGAHSGQIQDSRERLTGADLRVLRQNGVHQIEVYRGWCADALGDGARRESRAEAVYDGLDIVGGLFLRRCAGQA